MEEDIKKIRTYITLDRGRKDVIPEGILFSVPYENCPNPNKSNKFAIKDQHCTCQVIGETYDFPQTCKYLKGIRQEGDYFYSYCK